MQLLWCSYPTCLGVILLLGLAKASEPLTGSNLPSKDHQAKSAHQLASSWGLAAFLEAAGPHVTAEEVIAGDAYAHSKALVVATLGSSPPKRRNALVNEPFLRFDPGVTASLGNANWTAALAGALPALNSGAVAVEAVTGRPLYSLIPGRLGVRVFGGQAARPLAVYDISAGRITLNARVAAAVLSLPAEAHAAVGRFAGGIMDALTKQLGVATRAQGDGYVGSRAAGAAALVASAAAAASAAALASIVPLWFCIACPVVMGLLAPLALNAACAAAAEAACEHYNLPDADCAELWYGAFAVAMVLSLASAIPIVYVCRLPECARRGLAAAA